ncbi:MAG: hypothetical protein R6V32_05575 [Bacteroidales bacterium]
MKNFPFKTLLWVSLFAVAFAMIETAVVIYLREIFYPEGFAFPLKMISPDLAVVETVREFATLLLLVSIAVVAANKFNTGFAWFIYAFAIWDIFYYVFLYVFIGWPESLLTWDILFLLPFTWVGPVIAPIINSLSMILLAVIIIKYQQTLKIRIWHWAGLIIGAIIVIISYTEDYVGFMGSDFSIMELLSVNHTEGVIEKAGHYIPQQFAWWIFITGVAIHLFIIGDIYRKNHKR